MAFPLLDARDPLGEITPRDGLENRVWPYEQCTELGQELFIDHIIFQMQSMQRTDVTLLH